jgi:oxygen-independent coproporphyrinogen-3 oxidase
MTSNNLYAVYIHIPFCKHRCAYCDFNTYAGYENHIPNYVDTLCREIEVVAQSGDEKITACSIYFGGGTPSMLSASHLDQILGVLLENFGSDDPEISLEANPGTVSLDFLTNLRKAGFNRLSFGVQSFHTQELQFLERIHDPYDVSRSMDYARRAGFDNINLDLIYGLPEQTLTRWKKNLEYALIFHPEHLSLYALTIETGTPLGRWHERGLVSPPDPDLAADMYELASTLLSSNGYEQYEISNWSMSGRNCIHNLQYWQNLPYLGFGAGAHGFANGMRYSNVLRIKTYLERFTSVSNHLKFPLSPAHVAHRCVPAMTEMQETMMLGLRLTRLGVNRYEFFNRFGKGMTEVFGKEIDGLLASGLLEWEGDVLHLTPKGRLLGNQVFLNFV